MLLNKQAVRNALLLIIAKLLEVIIGLLGATLLLRVIHLVDVLVGFDKIHAEFSEGSISRIPEQIRKIVRTGVAIVVGAHLVIVEGVLGSSVATL